MIPTWLEASLWGLLAGAALIIGSAIAYIAHVPQRLIALITAFGSGVFISALSFELLEKAYQRGGFSSMAIGFISGAVVYTVINLLLARFGAKHRKRSGDLHPSEEKFSGSGLSIAIGAILDGIPESIVIGLSLLQGGGVSIVVVIAIFMSNIPESLSSTAGMKKAGRSKAYIFGIWGSIAIISGIASLMGYTTFRYFSPGVIAATTAVAAGGILAMLVDTMMPEAFEQAHDFAGLVTVIGFLSAYLLSKLS
ncbi:MAG: ZIP family zinc transporter [Actinobacteria bacterium]|nr:ZIP family zinc transporter [Actinomycetota bacterium]